RDADCRPSAPAGREPPSYADGEPREHKPGGDQRRAVDADPQLRSRRTLGGRHRGIADGAGGPGAVRSQKARKKSSRDESEPDATRAAPALELAPAARRFRRGCRLSRWNPSGSTCCDHARLASSTPAAPTWPPDTANTARRDPP